MANGMDMTTSTEPQLTSDTPEQAAFRSDVRRFLTTHSEPKRDVSPWRLTEYWAAVREPDWSQFVVRRRCS